MDDVQRTVATIALRAAEQYGFVLAGGNAIAMHGIGNRPSEDIDLFTNRAEPNNFTAGVDSVVAALADADYRVEVRAKYATFAQLLVTADDAQVAIDLGLDYRSLAPQSMSVGPVLSLRDAAGGKMATLYSRGLPRDFLDVDAIIQSGKFARSELIEMADIMEATPMDRRALAGRLRMIVSIQVDEFTSYCATVGQIEAMTSRYLEWADDIESKHGHAT